jgi:hypothetical protein
MTKDENINNQNYTEKYYELETMNISDFYVRLIRLYVIANAINKKNNNSKSQKIHYAQIIFLTGLSFIPILLGFLINAYYSGAVPYSSE